MSELIDTIDASAWAEEFVKTFRGYVIGNGGTYALSEDNMLTWFANAIETGRNAGRRELCPHKRTAQYDDLVLCHECGKRLSNVA